MEKIVKLEGSYDVPQLKQKLNEIIDYLNIQPQAEEKTKLVMPPSAYEQAEKEGFNMKNKVKSELLPESTPEQKEEWEERFAEFFLYVTNDKNWVDGRPEWKGDVFVTLYNAILHFIEKLLDEKEREAYEKGKEYQANLDRACYGTSFEKLEKGIVDDKDPLAPKKGIDWSSPKEVSKLTTK